MGHITYKFWQWVLDRQRVHKQPGCYPLRLRFDPYNIGTTTLNGSTAGNYGIWFESNTVTNLSGNLSLNGTNISNNVGVLFTGPVNVTSNGSVRLTSTAQIHHVDAARSCCLDQRLRLTATSHLLVHPRRCRFYSKGSSTINAQAGTLTLNVNTQRSPVHFRVRVRRTSSSSREQLQRRSVSAMVLPVRSISTPPNLQQSRTASTRSPSAARTERALLMCGRGLRTTIS